MIKYFLLHLSFVFEDRIVALAKQGPGSSPYIMQPASYIGQLITSIS